MRDLNTSKRKLGIVILVLLTIVAGYLLLKSFFEEPPPAVPVPPSVQLLESRLIGRKDGERQWEILAQRLLQANNRVTLTEIEKITMFQDQEDYLYIDAAEAIWDRDQDRLDLLGQVKVAGDFSLQSEHLIWQGADETITSPGETSLNLDQLQIRSGRMVLDGSLNILHLEEHVEIEEGRFLWRLEQASYDLNQDILEFYGNLSLEIGEEKDEEN